MKVMELFDEINITEVIKSQKLWLGHVLRMSEDRVFKEVCKTGIVSKKKRAS